MSAFSLLEDEDALLSQISLHYKKVELQCTQYKTAYGIVVNFIQK